ncbi:MAG: RES family NAD+ phosphorylase [Chitinophagaceae bacterium]|nr:RES family NAD+ phosphorylase [Chitinophagaceae bacterium]
MIIYRLTQSTFQEDLSGSGAALYGGRWNNKGIPVLYTSSHISLAVLEILVNHNRNESPLLPSFHLLELELPENLQSRTKKLVLKDDWIRDIEYTRFIGDTFLKEGRDLILPVPSVVIPEEHNYLLNPNHKQFKKIKIIQSKPYQPDKRLF